MHDITFVHHPELVSEDTRRFFEPLIRRSIERGASIHVVSDFVGAEVREAFGIGPERVHRVYPGIAATAGGDAAEGHRLAGAHRYVLGMGQLEPRKNFPVLVEAFDRLAAADPDLHLVVAGPDGWGRVAFDDACARAAHGERVRWIGYVGDDERRHVLAGAEVFAYPSLYEGFGHPPLEAMAAGIPVVATTAGSVAEVVGDAALLAHPDDVDALAEQIAHVLDDDDERARLVERGRARAAEFSWEAAAGRFIDMYRAISGR